MKVYRDKNGSLCITARFTEDKNISVFTDAVSKGNKKLLYKFMNQVLQITEANDFVGHPFSSNFYLSNNGFSLYLLKNEINYSAREQHLVKEFDFKDCFSPDFFKKSEEVKKALMQALQEVFGENAVIEEIAPGESVLLDNKEDEYDDIDECNDFNTAVVLTTDELGVFVDHIDYLKNISLFKDTIIYKHKNKTYGIIGKLSSVEDVTKYSLDEFFDVSIIDREDINWKKLTRIVEFNTLVKDK